MNTLQMCMMSRKNTVAAARQQAHPQAEEEEGDERVERFQKGQVERRAGKDHHQQQGHKAEHAVHHGKAALFQREDILGGYTPFSAGGRR